MTDDNFAANASGVAMKYKLMGIETATSKKERAFKKALQRRVELICNIFGVMGTDYDYRSIQMTFSRNIPANLVEVAEVINKVGHLLSQETQINLLPIDVAAEEELNRIEAEKTANGLAYELDE
jgi:SPP1 family phage portal protein